MSDFLEFNSARYSSLAPSEDKLRIDTMLNMVGTDKSVLELGCSAGNVSVLVRDVGNEVCAVDIVKACVDEVINQGIDARQCNLETDDIPFERKFDVVIAPEIIEHIYDTDSLLQKVRKSLKKNGELIITTPNVATLGRRLLLLFGKNPFLEPSLKYPAAGHIRYFTKTSLEGLLRDNGFEPIEFTSDEINFKGEGTSKSYLLARLFPTFGRSLILRSRKV